MQPGRDSVLRQAPAHITKAHAGVLSSRQYALAQQAGSHMSRYAHIDCANLACVLGQCDTRSFEGESGSESSLSPSLWHFMTHWQFVS